MPGFKVIRQRTWNILHDSVNNFLLYVAFYFSATINLHFLSFSKNPAVYAGGGLGTSIIVICLYSLLCSLNISVVNFGSHALGRGMPQLAGYVLHRAILIDLLLIVPISFLILNAQPILVLFGIESEIAAYTVTYASRLIPALTCTVIFNALHYFLVNYKIYYPQMIISTSNIFIHYFWCWFLTDYFNDPLEGVIYAKTLTEVTNLTLLLCYLFCSKKIKASWFLPDRQSFQKIFQQFCLSIEAGAINYFEEISYEIIAIIGGVLPPAQIIAQVALVNFVSVNYVIAAGIGLAANTYIAEKMGRGSKSGAISYLKAAMIVTVSMGLIDMALVAHFKNQILPIYSRDADVLSEMSRILIIYNALIPLDFGVQMFAGVLRAIGKEGLGAFVFFLFYYVLAIPLSYYFGIYMKFGVVGLWIGIGTAITGVCIVCAVAVLKVNWTEQISEVQTRMMRISGNLTASTQQEEFVLSADTSESETETKLKTPLIKGSEHSVIEIH